MHLFYVSVLCVWTSFLFFPITLEDRAAQEPTDGVRDAYKETIFSTTTSMYVCVYVCIYIYIYTHTYIFVIYTITLYELV